MEIKFWQQRWKNNQIGFHQPDVNPYLMEYFAQFKLQKNSRIFVPLCGKTLDIGWLLNQGMCVCAVELSEKAIIELFMSLNIQPIIIQTEKFTHYKAENIDIFVGNFFDLNIEILSKVDLIYDRAALVALPSEMRHQYVPHIIQLRQKSPQLLINYHYDQTLFDGPPFSIDDAEIEQLYDFYTNIECIKTVNLTKDVLSQRISEPHIIHEKVWFIQ